jgi:hypothetical protein
MDENTQIGQVQNNLYESAPDEGQQNGENLEPQVGEEEFLEVDGQKIPVEEIDNLKSYKHFQKKFDYERQETQRERDARLKVEADNIRLEERLRLIEEQKNVSQERQPLKEPAPLPPMPQNFSMNDAFDETTGSGQWYRLKLQHDLEVDAYNRDWRSNIETERQQKAESDKKERELLQMKNYRIAEFQKVPGVTLQEALETYDMLTSEESMKPEYLIGYKRFIKSQKLKSITPGQRPGEIRSASAVPSEYESKPDDSRDFIDTFGARGKNIFATTKT